MGKGKCWIRTEPLTDAHHRMSYLYQASIYLAQISLNSQLPAIFGSSMKEVSKKIVGKIHPSIKRSLCVACNYPLLAEANNLDIKIQRHKGKKRKKHRSVIKKSTDNKTFSRDIKSKVKLGVVGSKANAKRKNKCNRILWCCKNCGYYRKFVANPNYKNWIDAT